jgi:ABC-2 type transport system ATP-binding protein
LLDEPLSGLDPKARMEMRDVMRSIHQSGKTVIISSHVLAEMSDFCTSIGIIEKGVLRESGKVDEIQTRLTGAHQISIEVVDESARAAEIIAAAEGVSLLPGEGKTVRFTLRGDRLAIAAINKTLVSAGIGVLSIRDERSSLEDIYFQISSHEVQ